MIEKILSIIIPVYNVERYLEQCLQSIFIQNKVINQIEVVIVNDGSPDNSQQIIDKYASKYPNNVQIINQNNSGLSIARNNGLKIAKGEYIWFVDSDDWLPENSINIVLQEIKANPNVDVFSSFLNNYYEDNQSYHYTQYNDELYLSGLSYLKRKLPTGASQRFIYKHDFLNENNLYFVPKILHEDAVWGYMMLYKASIVKVIDKPIYIYRRRLNDSIMSSITIRSAYDLIKGHKLMCEWTSINVKNKDKDLFNYHIFGLIKSLLDFTKGLMGTKEYEVFLKDNMKYIKKHALNAMTYKPFDISLVIIAINPKLFSFICKFLSK